jgi:hypothetical protein
MYRVRAYIRSKESKGTCATAAVAATYKIPRKTERKTELRWNMAGLASFSESYDLPVGWKIRDFSQTSYLYAPRNGTGM